MDQIPPYRFSKVLRYMGLAAFLFALSLFTLSPFVGSFLIEKETVDSWLFEHRLHNLPEGEALRHNLADREYRFSFQLSGAVRQALDDINARPGQSNQVNVSSEELAFSLAKRSARGFPGESTGWFFLLTIIMGCAGALAYSLPTLWRSASLSFAPYHQSSTARGWVGWLVFLWLLLFYIVLYFKPSWIVNASFAADEVRQLLSGRPADGWFLYGLLYTAVMLTMGVRMFVKHRGNHYQTARTASVVLFQILFAFLLVEWLPMFQLPAADLKNIWPLDYSFFFDYRISEIMASGKAGTFFFVWGLSLTLLAVPILTYFYGKRWYCSWVCGCGGLAETLGDPFRHLSDKRLIAWKIERYLVHGVLVFAVLMTMLTAWQTYRTVVAPEPGFSDTLFLGITAGDVRQLYGFLIGSWFAGVIGTGFYPIFGNRVWCRFGCPLAAYLGLVQRFKSRFRITTNGGQCISCGNCSTQCEMGIDVRWYAQRGQNIVRSSCVGCGICANVCPRGVLKLENGPEAERINDNPILIGRDGIKLNV